MAAIAPPTQVTSTTPGSIPQQAQALKSAAASAGIPLWVLLGVYGSESTYGTAYRGGGRSYGYFGLTSPGLWNPSMSFQQDAETSAKLLAKLYRQHGNNWDAALHAYSGGGYGAAHAQQMANSAPGALARAIKSLGVNLGPLTAPAAAAGAVGGAVSSVAGGIGNIASLVTSGSFWLRVLEALGGIILLALGLVSLAGGSPEKIAATAAKVAK
jgi:hypothetical protein